MVSLSDMDDLLDSKTLAMLGDPILYTSAEGGAPISIKGFVDRGEEAVSYGGSKARVGDRGVELSIADVPVRPNGQCTVTFAVAGAPTIFSFLDAELDDSGRWWICKLKKKV